MEPSAIDTALIDAHKAIIKILVGKGVTTYDEVGQALQLQLAHALESNPGGASVFRALLEFCSR